MMRIFSSCRMTIQLLICGSDITVLAKDKAYTDINLNEMTVHQVSRIRYMLVYVF